MNFLEFKEKYQKTEVVELSSTTPKNPVVSILVQTYQQKDYIRECLDSIIIQKTTFDFEILIGEDGSVDGTREICLEYAKKYPGKIRLFLHHRENQIKVLGEATSNFNAFYNFYSAKGNYIAFCEGDDKWGDSLKLQKQVDFLEANKHFAFSYHEFKTIDESGGKLTGILETGQPLTDLSKKDLSELRFHPLLVTICFKRDRIQIPEEIFQVLNIDTFLLSLFGKVGSAKFQNNVLPSLYRFRKDGLWSKKLRNKKILSKIHTYRCLSSYYGKTQNRVLHIHFFRQMNLYYKMLILLYLKNKQILLAGRTVIEFQKVKFLRKNENF